MANNYFLKSFLVEEIIKEKGRFIIPTFQRNLVWKPKRKEDFIRVLRNGDPIGVILLSEENGGKYKLIDGLQRLSTIKAYVKNPIEFIKAEEINKEIIEEVIRENIRIQGINSDEKYINDEIKRLQLSVKKYISSLKNLDDLGLIDLLEYLENENGLKRNGNMERKIEELFRKIQVDTDIKSKEIHAIIYTGDKKKLPDVFFNLNTGSVSLSKYEILAASWNSRNIKIRDSKILEKIAQKYKNLEDKSGLESDFSEEELKEGVTLFEYCYAVSELIFDKEDRIANILFDNRDVKGTSPVAFEILSLILGEHVNEANKIEKHLIDCAPEFLIDLKEAIINTLEEIAKTLQKWIVDLNKRVNNNSSSYQVYHMFMSLFKNNYDIDVKNSIIEKKNGEVSKKKAIAIKRNLHKYYIYDELTGFWDKNRQVSDLTNEIKNSISRYEFEISKEKWNDALRNWFYEEQSKVGVNIPKVNKLFLKYLYNISINQNRNFKKCFENYHGEKISVDIEHIVPKIRIEKHREKDEKINISNLANLCYLTAKDNRSKKEYTIYENNDSRPSYVMNKDFIEFVVYPLESELDFLNLNKEEFLNAYEKFLKERGERIIKKFVDLI